MKKITVQNVLWGIFVFLIGLFIFFFYKCPIKLIFGVDCPGCGMTRAYKALLRLDLKSAFSYHELFPIPLIVVIYQIFRKKWNLGYKNELIFALFFLSAFLIRWIILKII